MRTIIKMVHHTRLDAAIGSAALMRQALAQALHHAEHRNGLPAPADRSAADAQRARRSRPRGRGATALVMRLARAFDRGAAGRAERGFARLATAIAKYWVCKRAPAAIAEAMECLGGNGYVEESILPRLYREAPVNSIWEGAGNVVCLDALRALEREPDSLEALLAELGSARGADLRLDARLVGLPTCSRTGRSETPGPAIWSSSWRWRSRPRSWSAMRRRRSPMRSAPRACPTVPAASSACCRRPRSGCDLPAPGRCRPSDRRCAAAARARRETRTGTMRSRGGTGPAA